MKNLKKAFLALGIILASQAVYHKAAAVITDTDVQTVSAVGNGVTTSYTIGFQFQANSELRVYLQTESTTPYTRTLLVYGAGAGKYTFAAGDPTTAVVLGTAPTSSQRVIIKRVTSLTQQVDYVETDAFPAENHEEQMDRMEQSLQELDSAVSYKIGLSTVSTYTTPTFPDPVADKWAIYNHGATDLTIGPSGSLTTGDVPQYIGTGWSTYNVTNGVIADLASHVANVSNPHSVTATQVGKDTAQWNASKIQGATVDPANIGNGKILSYNSGSGNLEYVAGSLLPIGAAETVINVNSAGTDIEYDLLTNANISASAAIADTKLATISTASKVSNSATTATASNTMSAIMARDASGQVAASTFTGNLVGNVTGNVTGAVTGNASTATALAADPSDCGASSVADGINASGTASCKAIVNDAVSASADIARTKLAAGSNSHVLINDGSGVMSSEATLAVSRGGTNIASYTAGDILYASSTTTLSKLAAGSASSVLKGGTTPSWGSVAGGDGVQQNLIGLDSNYVANNTTDRDGEVSVGNWTAYADAAGTAPVGMTGGSPNTTCTRVGASTMNGAGYFLMTLTTGATRQGEGCSELVYIPPAYRGAMLEFSFPFTTTGTITEDDIKLYAYDVTNSVVITPMWPGKILGAGPGKASAVFPISTTTAQIRVGLHVARASNTGAVTVLYDDVSVSPQVGTYGLAGSNSTSYSLTIGGTTSAPTQGSGATKTATYTRIGQGLLIHFDYTQGNAGSAGSGTYLFPLPSGLTATDPTSSTGGTLASVGQAAVATAGTKRDAAVVLYNSTNIAIQMESSGTDPVFVGSTVAGLDVASTVYSFTAWVPAISGWDANVSMASSSTFKISSYLASGSRVTATPTKLGEYRSMYKAATSNTSWTDTAPTAAPSVADGMRLYCDSYNGAGAANEANRYEIFIGKNKNFKMEKFSSQARTGIILSNEYFWSSNDTIGTMQSYDPSVGVLVVDCGTHSVAITGTSYFGTASALGGGTTTFPTNGYFDATISENALYVGSQGALLSSGTTERIERAYITYSAGTPSVSRQSGSWISSLTDNGTGDTSINITAGTFSTAPSCTFSMLEGASDGIGPHLVSDPTTSVVRSVTRTAAAAGADYNYHVICMGQR